MLEEDIEKAREIIEKEAEEPTEFFINLFRQGHSHVGLGENHDSTRLHAFVADLIEILAQNSGLENVCLEFPYDVQQLIDAYILTGKERHLQKIIQEQKRLVEIGYPFEGRLNSRYFDILRNARKHSLNVVAISEDIMKKEKEMVEQEIRQGIRDREGELDLEKADIDDNMRKWNLSVYNTDERMAQRIHREGRTLIYIGAEHLNKSVGIPKFRQEVFSIDTEPNPLFPYEHAPTKGCCSDLHLGGSWLRPILNSSNPRTFIINFHKTCLHYINKRRGKLIVDEKQGALTTQPSYHEDYDAVLVY